MVKKLVCIVLHLFNVANVWKMAAHKDWWCKLVLRIMYEKLNSEAY